MTLAALTPRSHGANSATASPIAPTDLFFAEPGGLVACEAEHFVKQELTKKRA